MSMLERYASQKENEFDVLRRAIVNEFNQGNLTEQELNLGLRKAFQYGHHAGHCRGETYRRTTLEELAK